MERKGQRKIKAGRKQTYVIKAQDPKGPSESSAEPVCVLSSCNTCPGDGPVDKVLALQP